jgi:NAD(P)-dependent dehydrogenase (short-subunit alcohol dehydrogenase family)
MEVRVMTGKTILVTGASRGVGRLAANALAHSGHTVYATMREVSGRNAGRARDARVYARREGVDLRVIELDVRDQGSVEAAVRSIVVEQGRIDVVVHNASQTAFGPAEAFTPEQFADLYDANVVSTQRVNRAVLPHMRGRGQGLLVWVSCSCAGGGVPPYCSPHVAAKAGMDLLAVQYALELARWGIETSIIVPGLFAHDASSFVHADRPADDARVAQYEGGPYAGLGQQIRRAIGGIVPDDADSGTVAGAITRVVDTPFGDRPFRVHIDDGECGASVAFPVVDLVRNQMLARMGFTDLLVAPGRLAQP